MTIRVRTWKDVGESVYRLTLGNGYHLKICKIETGVPDTCYVLEAIKSRTSGTGCCAA